MCHLSSVPITAQRIFKSLKCLGTLKICVLLRCQESELLKHGEDAVKHSKEKNHSQEDIQVIQHILIENVI